MNDGRPRRVGAGSKVTERSWPAGYEQIWAVIAAIPPGSVCSYGEVARRSGLPRRARLVAQALRAAPDELHLPWYRVLRADGRIAFEPGTAPFRRQRQALQAEGVRIDERGRVRPGHMWAEDDLDALLWRP